MLCQGSITALVTPFNGEGKVDMSALRVLIERQIEAGTDALVILGTTGETPTLSVQEQHEELAASIQIAAKRIPIIAGTGSYCTASAVEKTREAKRLGADACLVVFPYYNRPTPQGVKRHMEELASVSMPLILYHHPGRTGLRLSARSLAELLTIPEVIGIKDASGEIDLAIQLISMTDKAVLTGDDPQTLPLIAAGGKGVISVVANVIPQAWKQMVDLCLMGDFSSARSLFYRHYPLCKTMVLETNPQCVKYALSLMGLCQSSLRLPLMEPQESVQKEIYQEMQKLEICADQISTLSIG